MFFIIWGRRWKTIPLGQLAYPCSHCGGSTFTAVVEKGFITLFFVPLIPIGRRYMIGCNVCGLRLRAVAQLQEQLKELERTRQLPTPVHSESRSLSSGMLARACERCHMPLAGSENFCTSCGAAVPMNCSLSV